MEPITTNPDRIGLDEAYMCMAEIWAKRSKANRLQVGALLVKDQQIISDGYNGMPSGVEDDVCEYWDYPDGYDGQDGIGGPPDRVLRTKSEVLHAESNTLLKIAKNGGTGAEGATLYTTYSPCPECAKLIKQAKVARVVYRHDYRLPDGILMLRKLGVQVQQLLPSHQQAAPAPAPAPKPIQAQTEQPLTERLSMLVQASNDAAALRSAMPPPPVSPHAPTPAAAPIPVPPKSAFGEDDVDRLLREFEAHQAQEAAAAVKAKGLSLDAPDSPYRSTFF